jgi:hypothetical protein
MCAAAKPIKPAWVSGLGTSIQESHLPRRVDRGLADRQQDYLARY